MLGLATAACTAQDCPALSCTQQLPPTHQPLTAPEDSGGPRGTCRAGSAKHAASA